MRMHFPGSIAHDQTDNKPIPIVRPAYGWRKAKEIVSPDAIRWTIKGFKPSKTPGCDGISPAILQQSLEELMGLLISCFRGSLVCGYLPLQWKQVKVVFIPKPGRTSYE